MLFFKGSLETEEMGWEDVPVIIDNPARQLADVTAYEGRSYWGIDFSSHEGRPGCTAWRLHKGEKMPPGLLWKWGKPVTSLPCDGSSKRSLFSNSTLIMTRKNEVSF